MKNMYDFVGKRKIFFTLSIVIISFSLLMSFFGLKLDIEFRGGTMINYGFSGSVESDNIDKVATDVLKTDVTVKKGQAIADKSSYAEISFSSKSDLTTEKQSELTKALQAKFPDNAFKRLSTKDVNPTIGHEFLAKCIVAVIFSFLVLIVYIGFRFRKIGGWSAGVMGIVALLHDVLIVFGTFVIFRIPINANFIAVVLTILGYSINDTIVIYDRIRENETLMGKDTSLDSLVNLSINQCLTRSINTSLSTALAMLVVTLVAFFTGVKSILSFSFPLLIGLISGSYSTIFIASPLWVMWQDYKAKKAGPDYANKKKK